MGSGERNLHVYFHFKFFFFLCEKLESIKLRYACVTTVNLGRCYFEALSIWCCISLKEKMKGSGHVY